MDNHDLCDASGFTFDVELVPIFSEKLCSLDIDLRHRIDRRDRKPGNDGQDA